MGVAVDERGSPFRLDARVCASRRSGSADAATVVMAVAVVRVAVEVEVAAVMPAFRRAIATSPLMAECAGAVWMPVAVG